MMPLETWLVIGVACAIAFGWWAVTRHTRLCLLLLVLALLFSPLWWLAIVIVYFSLRAAADGQST